MRRLLRWIVRAGLVGVALVVAYVERCKSRPAFQKARK